MSEFKPIVSMVEFNNMDIALTHEQERMKMAKLLAINPAHIQDYADFLDGMIEKKKVLSRHAFDREVHELLKS